MFWTVRAGAPRSTVYVGSSSAGAGRGRPGLLRHRVGGALGRLGGLGLRARLRDRRGRRRRVGACSAGCSAGFGARRGGGRLGRGLRRSWSAAVPLRRCRRCVPVGLEVRRPRRVDAARVPLVLVVHLLDQPLVGAEVGRREVGLATWGLRHGLIRLFRYVHGECQVSRLDPHTSKCRPTGRVCGVVCGGPQPRLADFVPIGTSNGEFRRMSQRSRRGVLGASPRSSSSASPPAAAATSDGDARRSALVIDARPTADATPRRSRPRSRWGELAGRLPQAAARSRWRRRAGRSSTGGSTRRTSRATTRAPTSPAPGRASPPAPRPEARRDGDLMSNRDIGASIDGVEPERARRDARRGQREEAAGRRHRSGGAPVRDDR